MRLDISVLNPCSESGITELDFTARFLAVIPKAPNCFRPSQ